MKPNSAGTSRHNMHGAHTDCARKAACDSTNKALSTALTSTTPLLTKSEYSRRRGLPLATRRQHGQALVEAVVSLIVLVPLAAGITVLGQYLHIQQQTRAAARDAAWTAATAPRLRSNALPARVEVQARLRARHFAAADATLRSGGVAPSTFDDPMLTTFAGRSLLKPEALTLDVYRQDSEPGFLAGALEMLSKANPLGDPRPNAEGLITAEVHLKPEKILDRDGNALSFLDPLDRMQLDFSAKTVLLADAWDAAGGGETRSGDDISGASKRTVRNMVERLTPAAALGDNDSTLGKIMGAFTKGLLVLDKIPIIGELFTAGLGNYQPGRTAPDVVPADRLVKYKNVR